MKLRLVKRYKATHLYCSNGTILNPTREDIINFLTSFKRPNQIKGNDGFWNNEISDIEKAPGETLAYVDESNKLIILNEAVFNGLFKDETTFISATEYAKLHGKCRASIKNMCVAGRIEGAVKHSTGWMIPENAPYPERKNAKNKD